MGGWWLSCLSYFKNCVFFTAVSPNLPAMDTYALNKYFVEWKCNFQCTRVNAVVKEKYVELSHWRKLQGFRSLRKWPSFKKSHKTSDLGLKRSIHKWGAASDFYLHRVYSDFLMERLWVEYNYLKYINWFLTMFSVWTFLATLQDFWIWTKWSPFLSGIYIFRLVR